MKKITAFLLSAVLLLFLASCGVSNAEAISDDTTKTSETTPPVTAPGDNVLQIDVAIGTTVLTASLENNSSADAFAELLKQGDITVDMRDYGNFEKVGALLQSIERNDEQITTEPGDIILYQGNQITIYYDTNAWNFTRLGRINNVTQDELKALLGTGNVIATFRLHKETEEPATGTTEAVAGYVKDAADMESFDLAAASAVAAFDLMGATNASAPTVTLNSGYKMPVNGIGTYSLHDETCINAITAALNSGVRLIDTAHAYGNEEAVGEAIRNSGVPREEIFVITKLYPDQFSDPEAAIEEAMEKLNIGYIDMMLLHHPGTNDVAAYKAMEKAAADGKIRSIGLSNWYVDELEEFLPQVSIRPALVQNEIHPYYQENDVIPYIHSLGIVVQGWYPLGGRGHTAELLGDEVIIEIAQAHGVSSAQVILRWNLQKGVVVIPGSSNPDHIRENTELYGFALTADEMTRINALDRNEKHDWY